MRLDDEERVMENLYPDYAPEECRAAEDAVRRYVGLIWRIYDRLYAENPKKLTKILLNARFKRPRP